MLSIITTPLSLNEDTRTKYFKSFRTESLSDDQSDLSASKLRVLLYELFIQLRARNNKVTLYQCIQLLSRKVSISPEMIRIRINTKD
ncbi:hypothetical protein [Flammeovirga pacifica]|uniref:Uncharacterized protein n=1 Tax=Flammeovirga pacifica TaxID=915059 RepID=A0A1S1Z428_FLAPC|nr:hypothetical protein [Flammeovirga pacifica]OHX68044.1 hypothetical protein NH26_17690 [Flammeovirga pacifica]